MHCVAKASANCADDANTVSIHAWVMSFCTAAVHRTKDESLNDLG
jgi:hypothetical protein